MLSHESAVLCCISMGCHHHFFASLNVVIALALRPSYCFQRFYPHGNPSCDMKANGFVMIYHEQV